MYDFVSEIQIKPSIAFDPSKILFHARLEVEAHGIKKNRKEIRFNKKTGRNFIASNKQSEALEKDMVRRLQECARDQGLSEPLGLDLHGLFLFRFSNFHTKKGLRSKRLGDLDNLFAMPLDALEKAGVIKNDTQVCSFDLSRRLPSEVDEVEIFLLEFSEPI